MMSKTANIIKINRIDVLMLFVFILTSLFPIISAYMKWNLFVFIIGIGWLLYGFTVCFRNINSITANGFLFKDGKEIYEWREITRVTTFRAYGGSVTSVYVENNQIFNLSSASPQYPAFLKVLSDNVDEKMFDKFSNELRVPSMAEKVRERYKIFVGGACSLIFIFFVFYIRLYVFR